MEVLRIWGRNLETKQEIRQQMRKIRCNIEAVEWRAATEIITKKVIESDSFREATDLYCYMNFDSEVETLAILEEAWRLGKDVWLPKVSRDHMDFYLVRSVSELKKSKFGILEPTGDSEKASGDDGLMVVPGIAFDKEHYRIGYGKGYYDRYLAAHPDLFKIGIAFDVQIMEKVPSEEHDYKMDLIFTESLSY